MKETDASGCERSKCQTDCASPLDEISEPGWVTDAEGLPGMRGFFDGLLRRTS